MIELSATNTPLDDLVLGTILTVAGVLVAVLHRSIKQSYDNYMSQHPSYRQMWTGKYSKGGLIFTYGMIILFGGVLFVAGVFHLVRAFAN